MALSRIPISVVVVLIGALQSAGAGEPAPQTSGPAVQLSPLEQYLTSKPTYTDPKQIKIWQDRYPYQSLARRLAYEKSRGNLALPRLTKSSEKLLHEIDQPADRSRNYSEAHGAVRAESLRLLHRGNLDKFAEQNGFGMRRLPLPGPSLIEIPETPPVALDRVPPLSAEFNTGQSLPIPTANEAEITGNPWKLPTQAALVDFHLDSQNGFAARYSFGDVQNIDRVAGFIDHGIRYRLVPPANDAVKTLDPLGNYSPGENRWRIVRLELVSLLKHPAPVVYVSEHLPNMHELANARTRPLTKFEADSLAKLQEGEDLIEHSSANLIDMVGSVRAAKKCIACHSVPYGTMLGAFSYQLQRDPPIKAPILR